MMPKDNASLKDKTARGLMWGIMNSASKQVMNAAFGLVLTFLLTGEDYGLIGVLAIYSSLAASLQESGFVQALINKRDATHRDYNSVFWFNILTSGLIYLILWFLAPFIAEYNNEPRLTWLSRYAFTGFFLASFSITPRAILMKQMRVREQMICGVSALIVSGITGISMALCGMAFWSIATQSIVFVSMVSVMSWHYSGWRPSMDISFRPVMKMFRFSCKLLVTNIFSNINRYAFEAITGMTFSMKQIGDYSQANKWNLMGSQTISEMVQGVAQPMFVEVGEDTDRLRRTFRKMLRFTSFIAFPSMFGLSLVSHQLISLLPSRWEPAAPLLQMLCIGGAFLPLTTLYGNFIISRGKSGIYMWNTVGQSILIIIMLMVMMHCPGLTLFGFTGIHLMVLLYVSILILWILVWHIFVHREIDLSFSVILTDLLPFLSASALTMLLTSWLTSPVTSPLLLLLLRIIVAAALYSSVMWVMDREMMKECIGYVLKKGKKG